MHCKSSRLISDGVCVCEYRIAGNFRGRKLSGFRGLRAICKSFLREIWGHAAPTYDWFQAIRESFLREIFTSYGSVKVFSLESLPLYSNPFCSYSETSNINTLRKADKFHAPKDSNLYKMTSKSGPRPKFRAQFIRITSNS